MMRVAIGFPEMNRIVSSAEAAVYSNLAEPFTVCNLLGLIAPLTGVELISISGI